MSMAQRLQVLPSTSMRGLTGKMRILRGLSSRVLPCGCLTGLYETYDSEVVGILDARGSACADSTHQPGQPLPLAVLDESTKLGTDASQNRAAFKRL
jgi:hypothetical protein